MRNDFAGGVANLDRRIERRAKPACFDLDDEPLPFFRSEGNVLMTAAFSNDTVRRSRYGELDLACGRHFRIVSDDNGCLTGRLLPQIGQGNIDFRSGLRVGGRCDLDNRLVAEVGAD